nr:4'-phosphopantetheinyl transferase superfamily protein [Micromonospora sp. DSM 115978]
MTGTTSRLPDVLRELVAPAPDECHVWRLPVVPGRWDAYDEVLDDGEHARRARFVRAADRIRYQTAHVGVRLLLGGYLGVPPRGLRFGRDCRHCPAVDHGKPTIVEPPTTLDFSLSHSGDLVTIAVAAVPVGVDVQEIENGTDIASVAAMTLAPTERDWLDSQPAERFRPGFFGYWARKEAVLKATGHGLAVAMSGLVLTPPSEPARLLRWEAKQPPPAPVRLHDVPVPAGYTAAVALLAPHPIRLTVADLPDPRG